MHCWQTWTCETMLLNVSIGRTFLSDIVCCAWIAPGFVEWYSRQHCSPLSSPALTAGGVWCVECHWGDGHVQRRDDPHKHRAMVRGCQERGGSAQWSQKNLNKSVSNHFVVGTISLQGVHITVYCYTRYVPTGSYMYLTCVCMVTVTLSQMFLECLIVTWFGLQKAILMSVI